MKLLHAKSGRVLEGSLVPDPEGEKVLVVDGHEYGVLEASEEALMLIEATDEERQALVEAGYALPAEIVRLHEDDVQDGGEDDDR
ncbi:MAG: hypothetical protein FJ144_23285 [Deltaproteobacteria bacterium]|nr:hypothetical protein [Deltaproteobacteria bacterium]